MIAEGPSSPSDAWMRRRDLAACFARVLHRLLSVPKSEGAGKTGCFPHPRSRVPFAHKQELAHEHTGTGGASRPSLRNGFTAYLVLSPENGCFASVISERLSPPADLMPAPRHQDHTTSPYTSGAHVCHAISVHRIPPRVRDVRERPLIGRDGRSYAADLGENGSGIFLRGGVDAISENRK